MSAEREKIARDPEHGAKPLQLQGNKVVAETRKSRHNIGVVDRTIERDMKEITFNKEEAKALEALVEMQIDMIESEGVEVLNEEPVLKDELNELRSIHYKMLKFFRFK